MIFETANDMMKTLARTVLNNGTSTAPRGSGTLEILGSSFVLANPRAREITLPARKFSLPLAIGELAWHIRGDDDVDTLAYYTGAWRKFSDDGARVAGSCYGRKLMAVDRSGFSAWQRLVKLLNHDPSSRRATFSFIDNEEDLEGSKDVSCVSSIQFLIRDGKLNLFTFMRSNDLFLGIPYDVFLFSYILELMSFDLGIEMGRYHHHATSLHIYDKDRAICQLIADDTPNGDGLSPISSSRHELIKFAEAEEVIRAGDPFHGYEGPFNRYVNELQAFRQRKDARR